MMVEKYKNILFNFRQIFLKKQRILNHILNDSSFHDALNKYSNNFASRALEVRKSRDVGVIGLYPLVPKVL